MGRYFLGSIKHIALCFFLLAISMQFELKQLSSYQPEKSPYLLSDFDTKKVYLIIMNNNTAESGKYFVQ